MGNAKIDHADLQVEAADTHPRSSIQPTRGRATSLKKRSPGIVSNVRGYRLGFNAPPIDKRARGRVMPAINPQTVMNECWEGPYWCENRSGRSRRQGLTGWRPWPGAAVRIRPAAGGMPVRIPGQGRRPPGHCSWGSEIRSKSRSAVRLSSPRALMTMAMPM